LNALSRGSTAVRGVHRKTVIQRSTGPTKKIEGKLLIPHSRSYPEGKEQEICAGATEEVSAGGWTSIRWIGSKGGLARPGEERVKEAELRWHER
jgi:hypothetical protein